MARLAMRLREEEGMALVLALAAMVMLAAVTTGVIQYAATNERFAYRDSAAQVAKALAEAGVNDAMAVLASPENNPLTSTLLTPGTGRAACPDRAHWCFSRRLAGGWAQWYGTLAGNRWTIASWGVVERPGAAPVVRGLVAVTDVVPQLTQRLNAVAWNYMLARRTSTATACDMTLFNTAAIDSPLYVAGNLCLQQSARVYEPNPKAPVSLIVGGKLAVMGAQAKVGEPAQPITEAQVGKGCTTDVTKAGVTCVPTTHKVWARRVVAGAATIEIPQSDWAAWYEAANPGPRHPCTPASAVPTFDNDGMLSLFTNGSVPDVNLTPAYSYTCVGRDAAGRRVGELSWNHLDKRLTVAGAIYIDGNAFISNGVANVYDGHATLYLTGTFSLQGGTTRLCASRSGSDCDFTWDPNKKLLIIVPHGSDASGNSVSFANGVMFQGGFFAENAVDLGQSSTSMGPMIGSTIKLSQSTSVKPLPLIETLPLGAPGNPNTTATVVPPQYVRS